MVSMTERSFFQRWAPTPWAVRSATSRARSSALGSETDEAYTHTKVYMQGYIRSD